VIQLDGQVIVVTGAARGQGAAEVKLLSDLGARVVAADIDEAALDALITELEAPAVSACRLDIADELSWKNLAAWCGKEFGHIDGLVNNAGLFKQMSLLDAPLEDLQQLIAVNQVGCYLGHRIVGRMMYEQGGGAIVNVASVAALAPGEQSVPYGMTKAAIVNLTKGAALELAPHIRVNCILPGGVDTRMLSPGSREFFATIPLRRVGTPQELARAVAFFVSDASSYCTGASLVVDGGWTLPYHRSRT
jgi:3alpha(or 20beta)-hydroxysteroid dehydrogenase